MSNIREKYRFHIEIDGVSTEIRPLNDQLKWKDEQYNDECFWRKHLETDLIIDDNSLFEQFWLMQKNGCNCNVLPITISNKCCDSEFSEYWTGKLSFVDGDWDNDNCQLTIKPRIVDIWTKYLNDSKKDKNFLEIEDRVDINSILGVIECQTISSNDSPPDPPEGFGWVLTESVLNEVWEDVPTVPDPPEGAPDFQEWIYTYCRECYVGGVPPYGQWVLENGNYYRAPSIYNCVQTIGGAFDIDPPNPIFYRKETRKKCEIFDFSSDNGILFQDFIEFYIGGCFDQDICSNFFNINPDGTNPFTSEYQYAEQYLHNLIVFQTFEIVAENGDAIISGSDEQTAGIKKWDDIWSDLKKTFDVCIWHDKTNDCIRIEHISYIESLTEASGKVLNLNDPKYSEFLKGKGKFSFNKVKLPSVERWLYDFESLTDDWDNARIEYQEDCSDDDQNNKEKKYTIECFINDISSIYNNEDLIEDRTVINSITLMSTDADFQILSLEGDISGAPILNGALASSNLVANLHLRDRPACSGIVNGNEIPLTSRVKAREQEQIQLILSCDIYNDIDPQIDEVQTQYGNTKIVSMDYNDPTEEISLILKF